MSVRSERGAASRASVARGARVPGVFSGAAAGTVALRPGGRPL